MRPKRTPNHEYHNTSHARGNRTRVRDDALATFENHGGFIRSGSLHPCHDWAITSGDNCNVNVWSINTGIVLHTIQEEGMSIIMHVCFNYDGKYLALGATNGDIYVYTVEIKEVEAAEEKTPIFKRIRSFHIPIIFWMRWGRTENVLVAGDGIGDIRIWPIPSDDPVQLRGNLVSCDNGALSFDDQTLYAAYSNRVLKLWDLRSALVVMEVNDRHPMMHKTDICALACDNKIPLYVSTDMNGSILFCRSDGPCKVAQIRGPALCLAFSPPSREVKSIAVGTATGIISVYNCLDLSAPQPCNVDEGVVFIKWISNDVIAIATSKGNIHAIDVLYYALKFRINAHLEEISGFDYKPINRLGLIIASNEAKIFQFRSLEELEN